MFTNFIYLIIALMMITTYPIPKQVQFNLLEALSLLVIIMVVFSAFTYFVFHKFEKSLTNLEDNNLDHHFSKLLNQICILGIFVYGFIVYGLSLSYYVYQIPYAKQVPTLVALAFMSVFFGILSIAWAYAYNSYKKLYDSGLTRKSYVKSNIFFVLPMLLPWFTLSLVSDAIFFIPSKEVQAFLHSPAGAILTYIFILLLIIVFSPLIIQKFWQCQPLEAGSMRDRIENLCHRARVRYRNILKWPIFEGKMITAGVMGVVQTFRYFLVTNALLQYLEPDEIDAVIAHEIGHVKKHHLMYYIFFFLALFLLFYVYSRPLEILINYGFNYILLHSLLYYPNSFESIKTTLVEQSGFAAILISLMVIAIFLVYFRYVFGYFMRNFERQADIYVYQFFKSAKPLITTFKKIIESTGQTADKPNWHHFSVKERISYLEKCEQDGYWIDRHNLSVKNSMLAYFTAILFILGSGYAINIEQLNKTLNEHWQGKIEEVLVGELENNPENVQLHLQLGGYYFDKKKYKKAVEAYETGLSISPFNSEILNNLAWLFATCEDEAYQNPQRAIKLATTAVEISPLPHILDTLAAAYHANGDIKNAIKYQKIAAEKNRKDPYFQKKLEEYQALLK